VVKYEAARKAYEEYKGDQIPRVMVMSDEKPRETRIFERGDYLAPVGEKIEFRPPAFLPPLPADYPRNRLGLARWLFLPEHPLTARVQVNRMWQQFFGTGLVKTTEDMGVQSEYPTHMDLLDWLAVEFREQGWSQKRLHRLLVTSATYRQSSRVTTAALASDPENRLHARGSRFRMPAMVLRDVALTASGLLDLTRGGRPVYPYQPDQIWEALAITKERDFTYPTSPRRRPLPPQPLHLLAADREPGQHVRHGESPDLHVRASLTSTPLHALTTLNDPTWVEAARVLAARSLKHATGLEERLAYAFRRVVGRRPTGDDLAALARMHGRQLEVYRADVEAAKQLVSVGASPRRRGARSRGACGPGERVPRDPESRRSADEGMSMHDLHHDERAPRDPPAALRLRRHGDRLGRAGLAAGPRRGRVRHARAARPAASPTEGEAGGDALAGGRTVAHRPLRPQAGAHGAGRRTCPRACGEPRGSPPCRAATRSGRSWRPSSRSRSTAAAAWR
jgi:hypothetical protein